MEENKELLSISSRTVSKIISRANCGCSLCGWNDAHCDLHHIVPVKQGGSNKTDNLICVCPNCHRKLHQHGDSYKTTTELREYSFDKILPNWNDFYNPNPEISATISKIMGVKTFTNECKVCKTKISSHLRYCCNACKFIGKKHFIITKEELEKIITEMPMVQIAKIYKVSDNAVRKRCKKFNIPIPKFPVGYWIKKENKIN